MEDIMKIVKSLEESGLLIKGISETLKYETKEQKGGSFTMWLGTLAASTLGNALTGKGVIRANEGVIRAGQNFKWSLILQLTLKYKYIIKMNINLMVFIQGIICLK